MDLKTLEEDYYHCRLCGLHKSRTQTVPGSGNSNARVMFIGEGPGEDEDERGIPFVGASGRYFNMMLKNLNAPRAEVWITNMVLCRPVSIEGDNRVPTALEVAACMPRLHQEITLVDPDFLVLMGGTALKAMCPHLRGTITKYVGRIDEVTIPLPGGFTAKYAALIAWHPSHLQRVDAGWEESGHARHMTDDLRAVMRAADLMELMRTDPERALSPQPILPDRGTDIALVGSL